VCNIHKLIHKSWRLIQGVQSFDRSPRHLLADVSVLLRNGCGHVAHHVLHHLQWRAEFRLSSDECVPQKRSPGRQPRSHRIKSSNVPGLPAAANLQIVARRAMSRTRDLP